MKSSIVLAAAVWLGACATPAPTPYAPAVGPSGEGYRQQKIEEDRYRVTFAGNEYTPRETVESYLLLRAAELTLEEGFDWFLVTERSTEKTTEYDVHGPPVYGYSRFRPHHAGYHYRFPYYAFGYPWSYDVRYDADREYHAIAHIVLRHGEPAADDPHAYDAREVVRNLRPQVLPPGDGEGESAAGE